MEGAGKITFGILSVLVLMNFADGAIDSWAYDGGTAAAAKTFAKTLAEDATGTIVTVLATTDTADATAVTHTIGSQTNAGQFVIVGATGVITLASGQTLDAESATTLTISVVATDNAGTPETDTAVITLTITDVNEFDPAFYLPPTATLVVPDQLAANSLVYIVSATDSDQSGNTVTVALVSGDTDTDFSRDASNGKITVANALSASRTPSYTLVYAATDAGTPARTATSTVKIYVGQEPAGNGANGGAAISLFAIAGALMVSLYMLL